MMLGLTMLAFGMFIMLRWRGARRFHGACTVVAGLSWMASVHGYASAIAASLVFGSAVLADIGDWRQKRRRRALDSLEGQS